MAYLDPTQALVLWALSERTWGGSYRWQHPLVKFKDFSL